MPSKRKKTEQKRTNVERVNSTVTEDTTAGSEPDKVIFRAKDVEVFTTADGTVSCRPVTK